MKGRSGLPTLPAKEAIILELLISHGEMYGLQLVASSKRRLKRGTIYVTLGRMEEKGYIVARLDVPSPKAGGPPRRVYEATAFGRRVLNAWSVMARQLLPAFSR